MSYTVAKYIRISVEDQDREQSGKEESNSIANQRNLLAAKSGLKLPCMMRI